MKRWVHRGLLGFTVLFGLQMLARLYIYLRPFAMPVFIAPLLHSRWRRSYRKPAQTLAPLRLRDGQRVLELGPGNGLFTAEAAQLVGTAGHLFCVELQPGMLRLLRKHLGANAPANISPCAGDAVALPLESSSIDVAFVIAVLPMIPNRHQALLELRRVLKPGSLLAISEELIAPEYVPPSVTNRWLRRAGFTPLHTIKGFWAYTIIATAD